MGANVRNEERAIVELSSKGNGIALPQFDEAMTLFLPYLPCDEKELRRVYLRLALKYHPDKRSESERQLSTELFQAISAAYEELLRGNDANSGSSAPKRVKSAVAAAAELGDVDELQRLLNTLPPNAAVEEDELGICPLMFAAAGGCVEAAQLLVDFGADVCARNPIKWSVLLYAVLGNHADMIRWLVGQGAELTSHELILATYTGNARSFATLLELYCGDKASFFSYDGKNKTLLHFSCEGLCFLKNSAEAHAECVRVALRNGAPVGALEVTQRRSALQDFVADERWLVQHFENSPVHISVVEELCLASANVTEEDAKGESALSLAQKAGLCRVRQTLLAYA